MSIRLILTLSTFLLLILGPLTLVSLDKEFYFERFQHYSLYDQFQEDPATINNHFEQVLAYLQDDTKELETPFYNKKEKQHLQDVKKLYITSRTLLAIAAILFFSSALFLLKKRDYTTLNQSLLIGAASTLIITLLIAALSIIDFEHSFILFHKILFSNNLWILNPETDNLIKMLPQELFSDISKKIFLITSAISTFILLITIVTRKKLKNSQNCRA
ncbi:MAG TPA: TIGR01906 family membrane protein [Candidatus Nanoarchaeia archaeon]|nr:TIGR01906 family membrane protein [Candidatus Nanoarchaeia archaeon]